MKQYFYPFVFLALPFLATAQSDTAVAWQQSYGGSYDTHANNITPTADGGYIVAATTSANDGNVSGNHGGTDVWLAKLDAGGSLLWQKCLGGTANDAANNVWQTPDGGYVIAGTTSSTDGDVNGNHGGKDVWIVKTDPAGAIQWQKCFGGSSDDVANCMQLVPGNGYVFTATTTSLDGDVGTHTPVTSYWCVRIDSIGNIIWKNCFAGAPFAAEGYSFSEENMPLNGYTYDYNVGAYIQNTGDGGFIVAAQCDGTTGGTHGGLDYLVLKLDGSGNIKWQKNIGTPGNDVATCIQPVGSNGGYMVLGNTTSVNPNGSATPNNKFILAPLLVKLDSLGNTVWQKLDTLSFAQLNQNAYNFAIYGTSLQIAANGDCVVGGYGEYYAALNQPVFGWYATIDSTGKVKRTATSGGYLYNIMPTTDGGFIAIGDTYSYRSLQDSTYVAHVYIVKIKASILPAGILNLSASTQKNNVLVQWQTASENNTGYFDVQRSVDAVHFTTIGKVAAAGNSSVLLNYNYTDDVSAIINNYSTIFYRLQLVDKNGNITYSNVARVIFTTASVTLQASPNPVKDQLAVRINNYNGNVTLVVYDMAGRRVRQVSQNVNNTNTIILNVQSLPAGAYIVTTAINGVKLQGKFVRQ